MRWPSLLLLYSFFYSLLPPGSCWVRIVCFSSVNKTDMGNEFPHFLLPSFYFRNVGAFGKVIRVELVPLSAGISCTSFSKVSSKSPRLISYHPKLNTSRKHFNWYNLIKVFTSLPLAALYFFQSTLYFLACIIKLLPAEKCCTFNF